MKAPLFDLIVSDEAKVLSEIILADEQPKHCVRRLAYQSVGTNSMVPDHTAREFFVGDGFEIKNNIRVKKKFRQPVYSTAALHFFVLPAIFLFLTGILIYYLVRGTVYDSNGLRDVLIIGCVALIALAGCISFTALWLRRNKLFNSKYTYLDDLFILFDNEGNPCCVCTDGNSARVLYKQTVYKIAENKIKTVTNPMRVYMEYLDLFPQSLLDMSAYVPDRKKHVLAAEPGTHPRSHISVVVNETDKKISLSANLSDGSQGCLNRVHKLLIDLDKDYSIQDTYSCMGNYYPYGITLASVRERGEGVYKELKNSLSKKSPVWNVLGGINFNGKI